MKLAGLGLCALALLVLGCVQEDGHRGGPIALLAWALLTCLGAFLVVL